MDQSFSGQGIWGLVEETHSLLRGAYAEKPKGSLDDEISAFRKRLYALVRTATILEDQNLATRVREKEIFWFHARMGDRRWESPDLPQEKVGGNFDKLLLGLKNFSDENDIKPDTPSRAEQKMLVSFFTLK